MICISTCPIDIVVLYDVSISLSSIMIASMIIQTVIRTHT